MNEAKFTEAALGPDDFLLLLPKTPMTVEQHERIGSAIPEALRGRVLILEGMAVFVGRSVRGPA